MVAVLVVVVVVVVVLLLLLLLMVVAVMEAGDRAEDRKERRGKNEDV